MLPGSGAAYAAHSGTASLVFDGQRRFSWWIASPSPPVSEVLLEQFHPFHRRAFRHPDTVQLGVEAPIFDIPVIGPPWRAKMDDGNAIDDPESQRTFLSELPPS